MIKDIKKERRFIFLIVFIITLIGLLMVYESSSIYSFKATSDAAYFFKRQSTFFLIGLFLFFLTLFVDLELLRRWNKELLLLTILCLVVVVLLERRAGGAKRWLYLAGFNIQPSEILKISFLIYCADYFRRKKGFIKSIKKGLLPLGVILGSICLLLLLQPDLGMAVFWVIWSIFLLFIFKARTKHLVCIVILGLVASFFLVKAYPYRLKRIASYINPSSDPQGAGFQLRQSKIAYGEGGLWGVGLGESRQKLFFLPASHTDFVFSIVAEEFGLWGSLGLLCLFFLLFHKMFRIARDADDDFRLGILWGIILIFFLEITINIGVSCGLLPTKGLSLPFMSYGGSNLIVHYVLLGLFFNASRKLKTEL